MTVQNGRRRPEVRAATLMTCVAALLSSACTGDRAGPSSPVAANAAVTTAWTKVVLTPSPATVAVGSKLTFTVTAYDGTGSPVAGPIGCGWSSDKPAIATVSAGVASGVAPGTTLIKAGCGGVIGTAYLTVGGSATAPASVTVTPMKDSLAVAGTQQFSAVARDASGAVLSGATMTWSSSAPSVAQVNGSGLVAAVGVGNATITAAAGTTKGQSALTVTSVSPAPGTAASVTVSPASASITAGSKVQLTATVKDASGNVLSGQKVSWTSSAAATASVDTTGTVSGNAAGSATISATVGTVQGKSTVTVTSTSTPPATASVVFNAATRYQTITGWEATSQSGQGTAAFPQYRDQLLTLAATDLGITRLRVPLRAGAENPTDYWTQQKNGQITGAQWNCLQYTVVNDDANAGSINPAGFHFSELDSTMEEVVLPLRAKLAALGRHLYINLNYTAFNKSCGTPAAVHQNPQEYAEFALAAFQHLQQKYGIVPDAWEMILEPDNNTIFSGSPALIGQALVATSSRLAAAGFHPQFIAPSAMQASHAPTIFDAIATVPGAAALVSEISYHRYGSAATSTDLAAIAQRAQSYGTRSAMLEHIGATYNELIDDLLQAHVSAWQQFALAYPGGSDSGGTYYLVNATSGAVTMGDRTRYLRQFFHYVTAGATRVAASTAQAGLTPVGFVAAGGKAVLVVRATAAASFTVSGLPAGTYGATYTTAGATGAAAGADQTIAAGQLVSTSIPAAGLVTIFQK